MVERCNLCEHIFYFILFIYSFFYDIHISIKSKIIYLFLPVRKDLSNDINVFCTFKST